VIPSRADIELRTTSKAQAQQPVALQNKFWLKNRFHKSASGMLFFVFHQAVSYRLIRRSRRPDNMVNRRVRMA